MISKKLFVKFLEQYQRFNKAFERIEEALMGKKYSSNLYESDWVSIGDAYLTDVFGDGNCRVPAGDGKKVYWRADEVWPGQIFDNGAIRLVVKKWDDTNPRIQLEPRGERGYIELVPVTKA